MPRLVIIDASLNKRIASDLAKRGRHAQSAARLGLHEHRDPDLLKALGRLSEDWILVTADDAMPAAHADEISAARATIATIDPRRPPSHGIDEWYFDVVHRWVHVMETQRRGSVHRYSISTHRRWSARRR